MRKILVCLYIIGSIIAVQSQDVYVFDKQLNQLISVKNGEIPVLFSILENNSVPKIIHRKRMSNEYKQAQTILRKAITDSLNIVNEYNSKLKKYDDYDVLALNINNFLSSKKPYNLKKDLLKKSQIIADKYGLDLLIYADNQINSAKKSKFFVISLDRIDLKVHLKRILWKLNILSSKRPKLDLDPIEGSKKVREARKRLEQTRKYDYFKVKSGGQGGSYWTLGSELQNPIDRIVGGFENLGVYFVGVSTRDGKKVEEILNPDQAEKHLDKGGDFVFDVATYLIRDINTKKMFLVAEGFLLEYSVNEIARDKKFDNREALLNKVYKNQIQKQIDDIVLSYLQ